MNQPVLRVLGIDPGLAHTGWGVLENCGQELRALDSGVIVTHAGQDHGTRLREIYDGLCAIVARHHPHAVAVEQLFFARNTKTALAVAEARGVAILAAAGGGAALFEYTPLQIKQAVAGRGRADKEQVRQMVRVIARHDAATSASHATDALAAAICHCNFAKFEHVRTS